MTKLDVYYRSCPTAYYATGQWMESKPSYTSRFALVTEEENAPTLIFGGIVKVTKDCEGTFFRADPLQGPSSVSLPSEVRDFYWLQAPISPCNQDKFLSITNNSGKFLVFVKMAKIDDLWQKFKDSYASGILGYGLQCSSQKPNSHARGNKGVITVHTGDAFDLAEVAQIAWQIDQILSPWEGVLQYMTDRTTKSYYGSGAFGENEMLYSISSRSFIIDAINGGTEKKCANHFLNTFLQRFTEKAKNRQNTLRNKNWQKFLVKQ